MQKARILVVDDEPDLVQLLERHPRRERHEVSTAGDDEAALAENSPTRADLVEETARLSSAGIEAEER